MSAAEGDELIVRDALTAGDVADVAGLFRAYAASISVDLCFQNFDAEVATLPGAYVRPGGRLYLATISGVPCGCVALKPLTPSDAEMKRLYVAPTARGSQLGRRLVETVIEAAREAGYRRLFLDTLPEMAAAQALYRKLGFVETGAYVHNPVQGAKFFALTLL